MLVMLLEINSGSVFCIALRISSVWSDEQLVGLLYHLFVVDSAGRQVGIITLEDVIEEILKREIEDEFDGE